MHTSHCDGAHCIAFQDARNATVAVASSNRQEAKFWRAYMAANTAEACIQHAQASVQCRCTCVYKTARPPVAPCTCSPDPNEKSCADLPHLSSTPCCNLISSMRDFASCPDNRHLVLLPSNNHTDRVPCTQIAPSAHACTPCVHGVTFWQTPLLCNHAATQLQAMREP